MAYRDFTFPKVVTDLGLTLSNESLFSNVTPIVTEQWFAERLADGQELALGSNTEKARSESLIAPVLQEVRRLLGRRPSVFSGLSFDVDPERGLNGYCDFLVSRDSNQVLPTAPLVAVAEGKNGEIREGYGQCIAGMVAAWTFNERQGQSIARVYGISTIGTEWKLLRLAGTTLSIDRDTYYIDTPGRLLGVLCHLIEHG